MVALFQYKFARGAVSWLAVSNCFYFLCKRLYVRKEGRCHVCMRCTRPIKRREVIGSVSANCFLLKHNTKVWPFPEVYAGDSGELGRASSWGALAGIESLLAGHVMVSFHLFPDCNAKKCHDDQRPLTNSKKKSASNVKLHQKFRPNETVFRCC